MKKYINLKDKAYQNLPDFIKADYPTFIAFLQAYYEFLDKKKTTRNLDYIRDIDTSLPEFLDEIKKEISVLTPKLAEDSLFLKHTKDVYVSRGSEESYKLLFRLLYNKNVDIEYPRDSILKPSDGEWVQENSIFVKLIDGNIYEIENNFFEIKTTVNGVVQKIKLFCTKINKTNDENIFEVFFNKKYFGDIKVDDVIETDSLIAIVQPTLNYVGIKNGGSGFKIGQIFNIDTTNGRGTTVKVSKIGSNGEIERVSIISCGVGYTSDFVYSVKNNDTKKSSVFLDNSNLNIKDSTEFNGDYGSIIKLDYSTPDYSDGDYSGTVVGTFSDISSNSDDVAVFYCKIGAVNKYQGYYATTRGLLSYDAFIQDGHYYQDFSYVLKIDEALEKYKQVVVDFLHPVGRKLFGSYLIESDIELFYEISNPIINILIPLFSDSNESFFIFDGIISGVETLNYVGDGTTKIFNRSDISSSVLIRVVVDGVTKTQGVEFNVVGNTVEFLNPPLTNSTIEFRSAILNYSASPTNQDVIIDLEKGAFYSNVENVNDDVKKTIGKYAEDFFDLGNFLKFDFKKNVTDSRTTSDTTSLLFGKNVQENFNGMFDEFVYLDINKSSTDNLNSVQDNYFYNLDKLLSDGTILPTDSRLFNLTKNITDTRTATDSNTISTTKNLNDDASVDELVGKFFETTLNDDNVVLDLPQFLFTKDQQDIIDDFFDYSIVDFYKNPQDEINLSDDNFTVDSTKTLGDSQSVSDILGKLFSTSFYDSISDFSEIVTVTPNYSIDDFFETSDVLLPYSMFKVLSDFVTTDDKFSANDNDSFNLDKNISDSFSSIDFYSMASTKEKYENVSANDAVQIGYMSSLSDSNNLQEIISLVTNKKATEILNAVESIAISTNKTPFYDYVLNSDNQQIVFSKALSDDNLIVDTVVSSIDKYLFESLNSSEVLSLNIAKQYSESLNVGDVNSILFTTSQTENITANETLNKDAILGKTESTTTTDFGEVVKNPYFMEGNKYFAENYFYQEKQIF